VNMLLRFSLKCNAFVVYTVLRNTAVCADGRSRQVFS